MTVVPLFCAKLIEAHEADEGAPEFDEQHEHHPIRQEGQGWLERFNTGFNARFHRMLDRYERLVRSRPCSRPRLTALAILGVFVLSLGSVPLSGRSLLSRAATPGNS